MIATVLTRDPAGQTPSGRHEFILGLDRPAIWLRREDGSLPYGCATAAQPDRSVRYRTPSTISFHRQRHARRDGALRITVRSIRRSPFARSRGAERIADDAPGPATARKPEVFALEVRPGRNVASIVSSKKMSRTGDQSGCADPLSFELQEGPAIFPAPQNIESARPRP